ncbi:MAG: hypothetical protein HY868_05245 [Chloroflexi bacterium]|nr:hypothetical protein [Chloroflexota bacterium]
MKTIGQYLFRLLKSAPVIAVGIFDILLFALNAVGININVPTWGYWAFLGAGLLIENYRIYLELEKQKIDSDIVCGIFYDNHESWGDAISFTCPKNPDFRPSFGLVVSTSKSGALYKGVMATFSFYWRGDPPTKSIAIFAPKNDDRWQVISGHITNERPATLKFNGEREVVTNAAPLLLQNLAFHIYESLKGYILIKCEITSLSPLTSKSAETAINLSPQEAG